MRARVRVADLLCARLVVAHHAQVAQHKPETLQNVYSWQYIGACRVLVQLLVRYCSKACQISSWRDGHKRLCSALAALGEVRLELARPGEEQEFFDTLNRLNSMRWGVPAFTGRPLEFHLGIARHSNAVGEAWLFKAT